MLHSTEMNIVFVKRVTLQPFNFCSNQRITTSMSNLHLKYAELAYNQWYTTM